MYKYLVINLKEHMPTVKECLHKLKWEINSLKSQKKIIKIIHGFGSTGKGGKLRIAIRNELIFLQQKKIIKYIVFGENLSIFDKQTRILLNICLELRKDNDLNAYNNGITLFAF